MATRSTIAMEQPDGRVMQIYCHWDGYVEHTGKILNKHYDNSASVLALMLLGDLSSVGKEIGAPHDFSDPANDNWCVAYGRDRGETGTEARVYANVNSYLDSAQMEEFNYIWRIAGGWQLVNKRGGFTTLSIELDKLVDTAE